MDAPRGHRLLVVHPPVSIARDFIDYPYFADLGAVQLAAVLEAAAEPGDAVTLIDAYALPGSGLRWHGDADAAADANARADLGAPIDEVLAAIDAAFTATGPAIDLAIVTLTPFHRPPRRDEHLGAIVAHLARLLGGQQFPPRPDLPRGSGVVLLADAYQSGQHYVEADDAELLAAYPEVDAWVKYEAEVTIPELVAAWRGGDRPHGAYRGIAPADLDALPLPAWERVDLAAYYPFHRRVIDSLGRGPWAFPIDGRTLPMVTSRGCPFRCLHCSSNPGRTPGEPKTQRRRSAANLEAALRALKATGARRIAALDELLNVHEGHFDRFLALTGELGLDFEIPNGLRADYLGRRHFEAMRGRVSTISVSAESGAPRVVAEVVGKRLDLQRIVDAARDAAEVGVPLLIHYMIGLPGETAAEINQTLSFALDLWDRYRAFPAVQYATPLPGTPLAAAAVDQAHHHLPIAADWGPHFQGAPTPGVTQVAPEVLERFMGTFRQRLAASQGPQKLVMNVTYVCNNHCTFCAVGTRTQIDGHPTRQREHLDRYRRQGVTMVDFDGGEPTLNPELIPLIRYARAIGYQRINVTTNGRLCYYEDYAQKLVRSGLTTLLFSVHGADPKTHAQQVGVAEAYTQTITGIRNCVAAARELGGRVELGMNVTLTKGNVHQQDALAALAWELGLRWLNIQFLTPFGRATRMIAPDTAAAAAGTRAVLETWGDRLKIQVINLPFCFLPGFEEHLQGDLGKLSRHMVFVNNESVNLAGYLAERRTRRPVCETCPHACFCGGFYELDEVPEPPWLIAAADLVRPLDDPRRHESVPAGFRERVQARVNDDS